MLMSMTKGDGLKRLDPPLLRIWIFEFMMIKVEDEPIKEIKL
jgi:hypothetical protein